MALSPLATADISILGKGNLYYKRALRGWQPVGGPGSKADIQSILLTPIIGFTQ
jgi:hypothetical protein